MTEEETEQEKNARLIRVLGRVLGHIEIAYTAPNLPTMDAHLDAIRELIIAAMEENNK